MKNHYQVIVIGLGPGGMGVSMALKEKDIDVLVIEKAVPGGKINVAPRVDNYPGYKKIKGPDLAFELYKKYKSYNIATIYHEVISLRKVDDILTVELDDNEILTADYVVIASGTKERLIGLDKEEELLGHGLSYCSICDGHFFKNKTVAVIGGGNAALKEAIHLSDIVSKLYLIHRRNEFRGSLNLVNELKEKSNVTILTPYIPLEIVGEDKVEGLVLQNKEDSSIKKLTIDGLFPLVGQLPNTQFIQLDILDNYGTIPVDKNKMSKCDRVYAVGDVLPRDIRQIYLAEFDGKVAAKDIINKINS
ncbi:MAG: NAD(P)/FAD-dependent oxidoreductase [Bacilli bacterium]